MGVIIPQLFCHTCTSSEAHSRTLSHVLASRPWLITLTPARLSRSAQHFIHCVQFSSCALPCPGNPLLACTLFTASLFIAVSLEILHSVCTHSCSLLGFCQINRPMRCRGVSDPVSLGTALQVLSCDSWNLL